MKNFGFRVSAGTISLIIILSLFIPSFTSLSAGEGMADSPWPCAGGDALNTRFSHYHMDDFEAEILWTFDTERSITSTPVLDEKNNLYVGSVDNRLYSLASNGMLRWYFTADSDLRTSPLIDSFGTVYIGSRDGTLYAIDDGGELRWSLDHLTNRFDSHPVMDNHGILYVSTQDGIIYALHTEGSDGIEGTIKWSVNTGRMIYASPSVDKDGTIYIGTARRLDEDHSLFMAIGSDGHERWTVELPINTVSTSVAIGEDQIYFGSSDGTLFSFSKEGEMLWSYNTGGRISSSPAITPDGMIYLGSMDGHVYALHENGSLAWSYETGGYIRTSPAVSADGYVFIGSSDRNLYVLDQNGILLRRINLGSPVLSSTALGLGGTVYIGNNDGRIFAINGGDEFRPGPPIIRSADIEDTRSINITWDPPKFGQPNIYNIYRKVDQENEVYLISVKSDNLYHIDRDLEVDKEYSYRITAENHMGESFPSDRVSVYLPEEIEEDEDTLEHFILIGVIVALSVISVLLTLKVLRMKKELRHMMLYGEEEIEEEKKYRGLTCPHCGYQFMMNDYKNGRCPRCRVTVRAQVY